MVEDVKVEIPEVEEEIKPNKKSKKKKENEYTKGKVTCPRLNVRKMTSKSAEVDRVIEEGEIVEVRTDKDFGDWYQLKDGNYVMKYFISIE